MGGEKYGVREACVGEEQMPFCEKKLSVKLFNPNLTVDAALLIANNFIINAVSVNDLIGVSRSGLL